MLRHELHLQVFEGINENVNVLLIEIMIHDDVIKWKHFPRYWPFVWGIHRSPVSPRAKANDAELWCFLWAAPI